MKKIEKEIKYLINKNDFCILKQFLDSHYSHTYSKVMIINHYFDTDDLLFYRNSISVRLREVSGSYEATYKRKLENALGNLHIKEETNIPISKADFERFCANGIPQNHNLYNMLLNILPNYDSELLASKTIQVIGKLETSRHYYTINPDIEPINLDENTYLGCEDYEVEWETDKIEIAAKEIIKLFNLFSITPNISSKSKTNRFIDIYSKNIDASVANYI